MPAQFTLPNQYVVDLSGEPLMGARANFYIIGTSTRKNTYIDAALSEAHANPVEADAFGVFPVIWLDDSGTDYRLVLTDQFDVEIRPAVDGLLDPLSPTDLLDLIKTVDGAGSLLDADKLDGLDSTAFAQKAEDEAISGRYNFTGLKPMIGGLDAGYVDFPPIFVSGGAQLSLEHRGRCLVCTSGGLVIPVESDASGFEGPFVLGSAILFYNDSAVNQSITAETPATTIIRRSGTTSTGTRVVSPYGKALLHYIKLNTWDVSGSGVS